VRVEEEPSSLCQCVLHMYVKLSVWFVVCVLQRGFLVIFEKCVQSKVPLQWRACTFCTEYASWLTNLVAKPECYTPHSSLTRAVVTYLLTSSITGRTRWRRQMCRGFEISSRW
jgi:hypothetical protein